MKSVFLSLVTLFTAFFAVFTTSIGTWAADKTKQEVKSVTYDLNNPHPTDLCNQLLQSPPTELNPKEIDLILTCYSPVIVKQIEDEQKDAIGTPRIRLVDDSTFNEQCPQHNNSYEIKKTRTVRLSTKEEPKKMSECVYVDPQQATIYSKVMDTKVDGKEAYQLVYRFHYQEIYGTSLENHYNAGTFVLITLEKKTLQPLYITSSFTCGCYVAMTAINNDRWSKTVEKVQVHGSFIPAELNLKDATQMKRFKLTIGTKDHRVKNVEIIDPTKTIASNSDVVPMDHRPISSLDHIPVLIQESENIDNLKESSFTSSFFYNEDHNSLKIKGLVRGAYNSREAWASYLYDNTLGSLLSVRDNYKFDAKWLGWDRRLSDDIEGNRIFGVTLFEDYRERAYFTNFNAMVNLYEERCVKTKGNKCGI